MKSTFLYSVLPFAAAFVNLRMQAQTKTYTGNLVKQ